MKALKTFLFLFLLTTSAIAQDKDKILHFSLKKDSSYLFVDNSNRNWYTIELQTDTFFRLDGNMYLINDRVIQINSVQFDDRKSGGAKGSIEAEKAASQWHKKWEIDYLKGVIGKKLKSNEEIYTNTNNKPFLIWYYEIPKNYKGVTKPLETEFEEPSDSDTNNKDTTFTKSLKVTHQLFLDFVIQGNTCVAISTSVMENDDITTEINKLKKIANSLTVYGSYIDLAILSKRTKNNGQFTFKDSLETINIEIPKDINILMSPYKELLLTSFPEKENIVNAAVIHWEDKSKTGSFENFINKSQGGGMRRDNLKELPREGKIARYTYTSKNSYFNCQEVYIEGENTYCYVNFTATATTYDFNINRFNELISKIKVK